MKITKRSMLYKDKINKIIRKDLEIDLGIAYRAQMKSDRSKIEDAMKNFLKSNSISNRVKCEEIEKRLPYEIISKYMWQLNSKGYSIKKSNEIIGIWIEIFKKEEKYAESNRKREEASRRIN